MLFYSVFKEQRLPERFPIKQASAKAEAVKIRVGGSKSCRGWEYHPSTVKNILINLGDGEFSDSLPCLIPCLIMHNVNIVSVDSLLSQTETSLLAPPYWLPFINESARNVPTDPHYCSS